MTTALLAVAFALAVLVPAVGLYSLFLIFVARPPASSGIGYTSLTVLSHEVDDSGPPGLLDPL
jgi:hypothetical protein